MRAWVSIYTCVGVVLKEPCSAKPYVVDVDVEGIQRSSKWVLLFEILGNTQDFIVCYIHVADRHLSASDGGLLLNLKRSMLRPAVS